MPFFKTSGNGIVLIKRLEGFSPTAFWDVDAYSIGYGHHSSSSYKVKKGDTITRTRAESLLKQDLTLIERQVNGLGLPINQNQFDAIVSFCYNLGFPKFNNSTLKKKIQQKAPLQQIADEFMKWNKAKNNGVLVVLVGLTNRRRQEAELYCRGHKVIINNPTAGGKSIQATPVTSKVRKTTVYGTDEYNASKEGLQEDNFNPDHLKGVLVTYQIGEGSVFTLKEILQHFYDFSDDGNGKNKRGQDKLNIDEEVKKAYENNFMFLWARVPRKKRLELQTPKITKFSELKVFEKAPTEQEQPDIYKYLVENIPVGKTIYLERAKLDPVVQKMDAESYYAHQDAYYNPYLEFEQQQHAAFLSKYGHVYGDSDGNIKGTLPSQKLYPKSFIWAMPQARVGYDTPVVEISTDIQSLQFSRTTGLTNTWSCDLNPVKAKFDEKKGAWVKFGGDFKDKQGNQYKATPKSITQDTNFYYERVLNPGDVVYIKIVDDYLSEKQISEVSQNDKDVDFIGVIDTIRYKQDFSGNTARESISITGRCLMKYYADDTVFFITNFATFTTDAEKKAPVAITKELNASNEITQETFVRDRMTMKYMDLVQLIQTESVYETLNILMEKLKILPNEYTNPEGKGKVSITEMIMNDFDGDLFYRSYYIQSLASMTGSLVNFFKQFTPKPFTEMYGDTFPKLTKKELQDIKSDGIGSWREPVNFKESQRYHFIIRNAPLDYEAFNRLPRFTVTTKMLRSFEASRTDSNMYTAFQLVPKSVYSADKNGLSTAFPPVIFPTLAKRYGFKLWRGEASYFSCRAGINDTSDSEPNKMIFYYAERDLRRVIKNMIGNAFYEKGSITTIPLKYIRPGCIIAVPFNGTYYEAYITSVTQYRSAEPSRCYTKIQFERGLQTAGHELLDELIEFYYGDESEEKKREKPGLPSESYKDRQVKFHVDIFEQLMSKSFGFSDEWRRIHSSVQQTMDFTAIK